jgi:hypothetical protein
VRSLPAHGHRGQGLPPMRGSKTPNERTRTRGTIRS